MNVAEGSGRRAGDQRRMYETAYGSAKEVRAAIAIGVAWGWIGEPAPLLRVLDRLLGLLWGLSHPTGTV